MKAEQIYVPDNLLNKFTDKQIKKHGRHFIAVELPDDIKRGKFGRCFDNSLITAVRSKGKYRYVEGFAYSPPMEKWVHHAWLTDELGILAYDPTWLALDVNQKEKGLNEAGFIFVGVPMDTEKIANFVLGTEYSSVFRHYKKNKKLANKIFV